LIEIDEPAVRDVNLKEWWHLPEKIYLELEDGSWSGLNLTNASEAKIV
jgi:hypothetical protein